MGYIQDYEDIYRLARDRVDADSGDYGSSTEDAYLPQNKSIDILKLNIASEMENFRWPFALVRIPLNNEIEDDLITMSDDEKVSSLYQLPQNTASIMGVYTEETLPFVEAFISDYSTAVSLSESVSKVGADRILVPYVQERPDRLWLVYISNQPAVKDMTSAFQKFLVLDLATHIYLGGVRGRNSNIYRALQFEAASEYAKAKANVLMNSREFRKRLPTMLDVAYFADKDGQVDNSAGGRGYEAQTNLGRITREILEND